jgi:hypothetical protein
MCRWFATCCWKDLDKGYNFALNFTSIGGLHTKLWAPKVVGVPSWENLGLQLGSLETKWHLGARLVAKQKIILWGRRWWLPTSLGRGESCKSVFTCGSSTHQKCRNPSLGLATKARVCKGAGQEGSLGVTLILPGV